MTSTEIFKKSCKYLGYDSKTIIPDYSQYPKNHQIAKIAKDKIEIIIEAKNKEANKGKTFIPNYNDSSQLKFEPWFYMKDNEAGSSGFRLDDYDHWGTCSGVGSRLCYISEELGNNVIPQILDLYEKAYKW